MWVLRWIIPALAAALILSTAGLVSAQQAGAISGTVTDAQTGDPIEGVLNQSQGRPGPSQGQSEGGPR